MNRLLIFAIVLAATAVMSAELSRADAAEAQKSPIYIRTENYPRPPYSGATYYIYERDGEVICTKLRVCNKYDNCHTEYRKGAYKDEYDIQTGEPFDRSDAVVIPASKLRKHVCLTRFKLIK
jgi:hypothetical protein